jgi:hypothetical protein
MHRWLLVLLIVSCYGVPAPPATEYRGARWFDGEHFVPRTMWVIGDRFSARRPSNITRVVDLAGRFVVPPYGEGHNHWLEPALVDTYVQTYLRDGIFYVRDMSTPFHDAIRPYVNKPTSVDYIAAHQGFTGPNGHPVELFGMLVKMGILPASTEAVFVVSTEQDIDRVWPKLLAAKPDFVKLFLVHSDEYASRHVSGPVGQTGLDPALVPGIVRRAHAAHLRVAAHIEDAADFHVAISAGVDDIAHMPFVADPVDQYRLADADLEAAAAHGVTIATTLDWMSGATDAQVLVGRANLEAMKRYRCRIVIGTDLFRQTASVEVDRIAARHLMTNLELLRAWSITTPKAIFPSREIGQLGDGAEASFLVLSGDPLVDPAQLHSITLRVKQGHELTPATATLPALGD